MTTFTLSNETLNTIVNEINSNFGGDFEVEVETTIDNEVFFAHVFGNLDEDGLAIYDCGLDSYNEDGECTTYELAKECENYIINEVERCAA